MLPKEQRHIADISEQLAEEFGLAKALLDSVLRLTDSQFKCEDCDEITIHAAAQLQISMNRKLRQVIALCQVGQGDGAEVICRSIFESMLAQAFICADTLEFRDPNGGGKIQFTEELEGDRFKRGVLYFVYKDIKYEKWLKGLLKVPVMKEWAEGQLKRKSVDWPTDCGVSEEWVKKLEKSTTCSGLPVSSLAYSLGAKAYSYYLRAYCSQSAVVHTSWGGGYTQLIEGEKPGANVNWFDEDFAIARPLYLSGLITALGGIFFASIRTDYEDRKADIDISLRQFEKINERFEAEFYNQV